MEAHDEQSGEDMRIVLPLEKLNDIGLEHPLLFGEYPHGFTNEIEPEGTLAFGDTREGYVVRYYDAFPIKEF